VRSLVVWGGGAPGAAGALHRMGAEVLAWSGVDEESLAALGVPVRGALERIGAEGCAAIEAAGRTWARLWSRVPLRDGRSFRELATLDDTSLLWLAEVFIHRETAGPRCARIAETALRILETTRADEVDAVSLPPPVALLFARACTARGVLFHGSVPQTRTLSPRLPPRSPGRRLRGLLAPATVPRELSSGHGDRGATLVVLVGPATERADLRQLEEAVACDLQLGVVTLGRAELRRCETRSVWRAVAGATARLEEVRELLRGAPGLHEAYTHRGVSFADLAARDLDAILRGRLPEAILLLEAASALIESARPAALVIVGWPRDDRRCLLAAAARHAVRSLTVRTGETDKDDLDRADGGPRPTATAQWAPGSDPGPLVARLAECARASLEPA